MVRRWIGTVAGRVDLPRPRFCGNDATADSNNSSSTLYSLGYIRTSVNCELGIVQCTLPALPESASAIDKCATNSPSATPSDTVTSLPFPVVSTRMSGAWSFTSRMDTTTRAVVGIELSPPSEATTSSVIGSRCLSQSTAANCEMTPVRGSIPNRCP